MSLSVKCAELTGDEDVVLDFVDPEAVTPVRWRPRPDDKVILLQRIAPLQGDAGGVTWLGWPSDDTIAHITPTYINPGEVHLISEDGHVDISLEDAPESATEHAGRSTADSLPTQTSPALRLGRYDATSRVVCGTELKTWQEATIQDIRDLISDLDTYFDDTNTFDTAETTMTAALAVLMSAWQIYLIVHNAWVDAVQTYVNAQDATMVTWSSAGAVAGGYTNANQTTFDAVHSTYKSTLSTFASSISTFQTALSTYQTAILAHQGPGGIATVKTELGLVDTDLDTQSRDIPDHLSDYVFTSKEPKP